MKNAQKLLLIAVSIYLICVVALTFWYFSLHYLTPASSENIVKTITGVGMIGAIFPAIFLFLIYYLIKKTMNKSSKTFLIIILFLLLVFSIYNLTLVMAFHDIEDSKSFLQSLIEVV